MSELVLVSSVLAQHKPWLSSSGLGRRYLAKPIIFSLSFQSPLSLFCSAGYPLTTSFLTSLRLLQCYKALIDILLCYLSVLIGKRDTTCPIMPGAATGGAPTPIRPPQSPLAEPAYTLGLSPTALIKPKGSKVHPNRGSPSPLV